MGIHTWFYDGSTNIDELHDLFRLERGNLPKVTTMKELLRLVDLYKVKLSDEDIETLNIFFKEFDEPIIEFG